MLTRKPRKGDRLRWPGGPIYTVVKTPEDHAWICWIQRDGMDPTCFIWRFNEGFNTVAEIVEEAA
jgi:hypothetical protein